MTEQEIRKIIKEEISRSSKASRFGYKQTTSHFHDGFDAPKIPLDNIEQNPVVTTTLLITKVGSSVINLNFPSSPRHIQMYGIVIGPYLDGVAQAISIGSASLTKGFYSIGTDGKIVDYSQQYPVPRKQLDGTTGNVPIQSSVFISITDNDNLLGTQHHILDVYDSEDVKARTSKARITVVEYGRDRVKLDIPYLNPSWNILLSCVIS